MGKAQRVAQRLTTPRELLSSCLRQMLWIEQRLANDVLPELSEQARSTDLRHGFARHLLETRDHVDTVRDVLGDLRTETAAEESPGFRGILQEREQLLSRVAEGDDVMHDLAHAVAALATEHLELAAYESLVTLAESLGEEEVGIRLREVLEQEELALEQVERALAKLLAEKVESPRL